MKAGVYWYKGPLVRDGQYDVDSQRAKEWITVCVNKDQSVFFMGSDWDVDPGDLKLMMKLGQFLWIEPPQH